MCTLTVLSISFSLDDVYLNNNVYYLIIFAYPFLIDNITLCSLFSISIVYIFGFKIILVKCSWDLYMNTQTFIDISTKEFTRFPAKL